MVNLTVQNLDLEELTVHVKQAKGQKDRISVIPKALVTGLDNLTTAKKPGTLSLKANVGENYPPEQHKKFLKMLYEHLV